jgi:hypothetical protein
MNGTRAQGIRRWSVGGAALAVAIALAGCGSDGDASGEATGEATGEAEETAAATTEGGGDVAAFCQAAVEAETASAQGPDIDFETATPEEIQAALTEYGARLEPALAQAEETAPDDISDSVRTVTGIIRQALETGDDTAFEDPEYVAADDAIDEYVLAECGFEEIQATGVDFAYEGIPDTVPAGVLALTFDNQGEELHEIALVRINDGVTQSLQELVALPEEEAMSMVAFAGAGFAEPGEADTVLLTLEPGRYGAVCFIPEGTTHDTEGSGPPHAALGMLAEFTVE